jgi:hypothetical protein
VKESKYGGSTKYSNMKMEKKRLIETVLKRGG